MGEFNVTCYIDEDAINQKIQNSITRYAKSMAKETITEIIREEVQKTLSKVDIKEIIHGVYAQSARRDVEQLLYKIHRDDYERFSWNGKVVDPTPEKMFKLITSYVSYIDLMDDPEFKEHVLDKAAYEIYEKITSSFGKNRGYKKVLETIRAEMEEKE